MTDPAEVERREKCEDQWQAQVKQLQQLQMFQVICWPTLIKTTCTHHLCLLRLFLHWLILLVVLRLSHLINSRMQMLVTVYVGK